MWRAVERFLNGHQPSGWVVWDGDAVVCIVPKNKPRTQAECERIAREIADAHNRSM